MDAPDFFPDLLREWNLRVTDELVQGWESYVVGVETDDGAPAVLKFVNPAVDNGELLTEIDALELMRGPAMVELLRSDRERGVMLLARLSPGTSLVDMAKTNDQAATAIAADIMVQLRRPVPEVHAFRTTEALFDEFASMNVKESELPDRLLSRARSVFYELVETQSEFGLHVLHGDLHHLNILNCGGAKWRAIDPQAAVADAAYEAAALLRNPFTMFDQVQHLDRFLFRRVDQLAEQLDCDRQRVKAWAFAQTALCVLWVWTGRGELHQPWLRCTEALRV